MTKETQVSITVIRRLPKYYRYLSELLQKGINRISSQELSKLTGFTASQIRQDLNNFGGFGQQGYGYNVEELHKELGKILGLNKEYKAVVAGAGNLGNAIANYGGFKDAGFDIIGVFSRYYKDLPFDMEGLEVRDMSELEDFIKDNNVDIGIITTSKDNAQKVADIYIKSGIKGIWNFAPVDLVVPEDIVLENVRLSDSLYTLSYFLKGLGK
ncbi:redox-sensing transcriptional repressor Rex [Wansuia hejianensis]|uniref:Redox-sensing transcriptional repressor Rex n=1 Tax=Wansuia hejianensis TaxID=2763667 RepID=A0A926IGX3_9FIRM|nr:redox-sensing transcriptional repressor Rex [Wansuia hejianensis]MBC8590037.1 redox-sensing transcriptional repressor Rex [Wansuia hejianensis]